MKHFIIAICFLVALPAFAQEAKTKLPVVKIKNLKGEVVSTATLSNNGKPILIDFWATWCKPCIAELQTISSLYEEWQKETGVKIIAVSIDDARNKQKVAPFVNGRSWEYEVYIDENADFKRALNVAEIPHSFLINGDGEIVAQYKGFAQGEENHIYEAIKKVAEEDKAKKQK